VGREAFGVRPFWQLLIMAAGHGSGVVDEKVLELCPARQGMSPYVVNLLDGDGRASFGVIMSWSRRFKHHCLS